MTFSYLPYKDSTSLAQTSFSLTLYLTLAFWLTFPFILCNFGLYCHLLLFLTFVACRYRHLLDYLPFCCPLLTSSLLLLFYLTINCVSSSPFISLTRSFLLVMLFVFSVGLIPLSATFSSFHFFVLVFLCYSPSIALFCFTVCLPSPPSLILFHFLCSIFSFCHFSFSHSSCLWFWAMFTKHIGTWWWSMSFAMILHTYTHAHTHAHTHACKHRPVGDGG